MRGDRAGELAAWLEALVFWKLWFLGRSGLLEGLGLTLELALALLISFSLPRDMRLQLPRCAVNGSEAVGM